jgi:hypothetical protein
LFENQKDADCATHVAAFGPQQAPDMTVFPPGLP